MAGILIEVIASFIWRHHWQTVYIVGDKTGNGFSVATTGSAVLRQRLLSRPGSTVYVTIIDSAVRSDQSFGSILTDIRSKARIVFFWGIAHSLRQLLITAEKMNMTGPEYVYIAADPLEYTTSLYGNYTWQNHDDDDAVAFAAFHALFIVVPTSTATSDTTTQTRWQLAQQMMERSRRDYNYTYGKGDVPSPIVLAAYSSVQIVGRVLDSVWRSRNTTSGPDLSQSAFLAALIANHSFETKAGSLSFDQFGERIIQFDVRQFSAFTGGFQIVLQEVFGKPGEFLPVRNTTWRNGMPPLDSPFCGYDGTSGTCALSGGHEVVVQVVSCLLLLLLISAFIFGWIFRYGMLMRLVVNDKKCQENDVVIISRRNAQKNVLDCTMKRFDISADFQPAARTPGLVT
ncbi:hypothetical protein BV898_09742 [Hypsibius exemplaris]|uniref:Receptor ligand binding region domain-containing protein n=1 Tax=Hypsibius exemplaris TaxID=2072580 RepID=A0A1W0WLL6_HYPEX|nr:hypothetical protein BV898_09742 [Hypsibius exemplaris]